MQRILFYGFVFVLVFFNSGIAKIQKTVTALELYSFYSGVLQNSRIRVQKGDPAYLPAYRSLVQKADSLLTVGPFSVMDKSLVPNSGDKHDYMSFGPYWWPDPEKEDGLPYIRRDGEVNPETRGSRSDYPSLRKMVSAVETLALAYFFSGKEIYARRAADLIRVFFLEKATRMNPHLQYGQAIPGRVDGRGIGIIETRRLVRCLNAIGLIAGSEHWTDADQMGMVNWISAYLDWLITSENGIDESNEHNNHGTWYDVQVASFALFVGRDSLARVVIEQSKQRRIASQIEPDGCQPHELSRTKSFGYSLMNLTGMFDLATIGEHLGIDLWNFETADGRGIRKALDFLAQEVQGKAWNYEQIVPIGEYMVNPGDYSDLFTLFRRAELAYGDSLYGNILTEKKHKKIILHIANLLFRQLKNKE